MMMTICTPTKKMPMGFSLVEILVVLVLFSLLSLLFLQGLSYINQLGQNGKYSITKQRHTIMQEAWIRTLVSGIMTQHPRDGHLLQANANALQGMTHNPLDNTQGVPLPFNLDLKVHRQHGKTISTLYYSEGVNNPARWEIAQWSGDTAHFSFKGSDTTWLKTWPRQTDTASGVIPHMICICGIKSPILIHIMGRKMPPEDVRDALFS